MERLEIAAGIAADLGLEVWFSPFTCDLTYTETLELLADCAERAERLRQQGAEVLLVVGAEISLLNKGFLPGQTIGERMELCLAVPPTKAQPTRARAAGRLSSGTRTRSNRYG